MGRRRIASLKVGKIRVDIYDLSALEFMLTYLRELQYIEASSKDGSRVGLEKGAPEELVEAMARASRDLDEISFVRDNPWLEVLSRRGVEAPP